MKRKLLVTGAITLIMSFSVITAHADNAKAVKVSTQTSAGIVHTSDDSVYIDSEDIKNLRTAVNMNADLLDSKLGMVENKADGIILQTPVGSPKIQCEYTAATGSGSNHLKITLR